MAIYDSQKVMTKNLQIFKMSVLENFLLDPMIFLAQNEAGVMRYSSTSDFGSSGTKRGTVAYRCHPYGYGSHLLENIIHALYHSKDISS